MTKKKNQQTRGAELLADALKNLEEEGLKEWEVGYDPDGEPVLTYAYGARGHATQIAVVFRARGLGDYLAHGCAKTFDDYCDTARAGRRKLGELFPEAARAETVEEVTRFALRLFIFSLKHKFDQALREQDAEIMYATNVHMRQNIPPAIKKVHNLNVTDPIDLKKERRRLVDAIRSERSTYLARTVAAIEGRANFSRIGEHYYPLLDKWQKAKKKYRKHARSPKWEERVREDMPGADFPRDLLLRLAGRLGELTEEEAAGGRRVGLGSSPSDLAAEHAARMCGASPYTTPRSTLRAMVKKHARAGITEAKGTH